MASFQPVDPEKVMPRLLSVNVGLPRDISWQGRIVHTVVWKRRSMGRAGRSKKCVGSRVSNRPDHQIA
jgi:hypothetical protein